MTVNMFRVSTAFLFLALILPWTCGAQTLPSTAEERFKALDVNHDGVVSKYEYDSDVAFAVMDSDHNYHISASELQGVLGPQQDGTPAAAHRIAVADRNGDKELSDEELRRALEFRFNWMDSNKDGNVDLPEMKAGFGVPMLN